MSKAKFEAAKELINEKQYDQARAILLTIDHPTAQKWLEKLDQIAPVSNRLSSLNAKTIRDKAPDIGLVPAAFNQDSIASRRLARISRIKTIINSVVIIFIVFLVIGVIGIFGILNRPDGTNNTLQQNRKTDEIKNDEVGTKNNPVPLGNKYLDPPGGYKFPGIGTLVIYESSWDPNVDGVMNLFMALICDPPYTQQCAPSMFTLNAVGGSGTTYDVLTTDDYLSQVSPLFEINPQTQDILGNPLKIYRGFTYFNLTKQEKHLVLRVHLSGQQDDVFFKMHLIV